MQDQACKGRKRKPRQVLNLAPDLPGPQVLAALRQAAQGHQVLHFRDLSSMQLPFEDAPSLER